MSFTFLLQLPSLPSSHVSSIGLPNPDEYLPCRGCSCNNASTPGWKQEALSIKGSSLWLWSELQIFGCQAFIGFHHRLWLPWAIMSSAPLWVQPLGPIPSLIGVLSCLSRAMSHIWFFRSFVKASWWEVAFYPCEMCSPALRVLIELCLWGKRVKNAQSSLCGSPGKVTFKYHNCRSKARKNFGWKPHSSEWPCGVCESKRIWPSTKALWSFNTRDFFSCEFYIIVIIVVISHRSIYCSHSVAIAIKNQLPLRIFHLSNDFLIGAQMILPIIYQSKHKKIKCSLLKVATRSAPTSWPPAVSKAPEPKPHFWRRAKTIETSFWLVVEKHFLFFIQVEMITIFFEIFFRSNGLKHFEIFSNHNAQVCVWGPSKQQLRLRRFAPWKAG